MTDSPIVFFNGQMVRAGEARLNVHDLGVVLGATVSEMARTFHQRLFRLEDHLARLARSIECVGLELGMSLEGLGRVAGEVVEHNARLIGPEGELGLVIFVTAGESPLYAGGAPARREPTLCVHTFPMPFHVWAESMRHGARLVTPSVRHVPPRCIPATIKHRSRMHYYLAQREAETIEPGAVPLLLDIDGNVAETNTANFLMVERGTIVSPSPANILPGISREVIVELADELGIPFTQRAFGISEVSGAEEAFLASTPYCVMPVARVNGRPIGDGRPGDVFRRLIDAWSRRVGLDVYRQIAEAREQE